MVQGCGRRKGLVTGRTASVGAGIQPGLLGPKRSLIPISHQRLGFPSPLPHHHLHTEKRTLLQFPWQRVSLRFSPSPSQRLQEGCTCVRVHACVCVCTSVLGRIRLEKKPSRRPGRHEQRWVRSKQETTDAKLPRALTKESCI